MSINIDFNQYKNIDLIKSNLIWVERPLFSSRMFIDRTVELNLISDLMQRKNVITVSGGKGVGKTDLIRCLLKKYKAEEITQVWYTTPPEHENKWLLDDLLCAFLASHEKNKMQKYTKNKRFPYLEDSAKSKLDFLYNILRTEKVIVVMDDIKQEHIYIFQELSQKLQKDKICRSKIIFIGRNIRVSNDKEANVTIGGFNKDELLHFYELYSPKMILSEEDINMIWALTYGIPQINSYVIKALNRSCHKQSEHLLECDISQIDEIQDYLYSIFSNLTRQEKSLLKILIKNQGRMKYIKLYTYAFFLYAVGANKTINRLIERSAIYKDETGFFVPKIANDYLLPNLQS